MDTGIELAVDTASTQGCADADYAGAADDAGAAGRDVPSPGVDAATAADCTVVRLAGVLEPGSATSLVTRLRDVLVAHGGVVADVSGLELRDGTAVHAFVDALAEAGEWPDVRLAIAAPGGHLEAMLASSLVAQRVVVADDVPAATRELTHRPAVVCAHWDFTVSALAPGIARGHVRRVCGRWAVDDEVCEAAEIVVTELVTNAVEHALSCSEVAVERRVGSFRMTVRDYDTTMLPDAVLPPPSSARGRGLAMVAAVSREWGVHHHADGKTVWAEMSTG